MSGWAAVLLDELSCVVGRRDSGYFSSKFWKDYWL